MKSIFEVHAESLAQIELGSKNKFQIATARIVLSACLALSGSFALLTI